MAWDDWFGGLRIRERRRSARAEKRGLVVHYWDGAASAPRPVRNISSTGFSIYTTDRWMPGTLIMTTLQQTGKDGTVSSITVQSRVVRSDHESVAFAFLAPAANSSRGAAMDGSDHKQLHGFLSRLRADEAQALVEYILMIPLVFLLVVNVVNFGGFLYAWIAVANAARAASDYAIMGAATVGAPALPGATAINNIITQDVLSLPNNSSIVVNICKNNNGTISTLYGTCTSIPGDPEPTSNVLTSIDVTYTYQPFISAGYQFPGFNIYATIPPTTIRRRTVMRSE